MIVILSYPNDMHAAAVHWVLDKNHNAKTDTFFASDFPAKSSLSISIGERSVCSEPSDPDTVWRRRLTRPVVAPATHPDDAAFVERENQLFMDGYVAVQWRSAFWVNDNYAASRANSKAVQLVSASRVGWTIPRTLLSNDPARAREFFRANKSTIYKPFLTPLWKSSDGKTHTTMTTELTNVANISDTALASCAGIYQEKIAKDYEIRVTVMGCTCFAAKIHSQDSRSTETDWRMGFYGRINIERIYLPKKIEQLCIALLRELGLVFGAIDLAVTPDGDYVFFEVNEMGQFLWVEEMCPSIPLLDAFAKFLIASDVSFVYDEKRSSSCAFSEVTTDESCQVFLSERVRAHGEHLPGALYQDAI
jgi:glutathione synthase/RimK-type ligase-like ATP-grasp enzyme